MVAKCRASVGMHFEPVLGPGRLARENNICVIKIKNKYIEEVEEEEKENTPEQRF